jgi:PAS domain S-box-containing protein
MQRLCGSVPADDGRREMGYRVLVIENDPGDLRLIVRTLTEDPETPFDVDRVGSLYDGLDRLKRDPIDLVLLDLDLPDGRGTEAFVRIHAAVPLLPVIVLVSQNEVDLGIKAVLEGAHDYLLKGRLTEEEVDRSVRDALHVGEGGAGHQAAEVKAESCMQIAEVILLALDVEGRIRVINRKGCEVLGYEEYELLGKDWFKICLPREESAPVRSVFDSIVAGEIEPFEYHSSSVVTKDRRVRNIAWHNAVLREESGRIIGTLSSGEDVTEKRLLEQALRESEEKYRTLAENSVDVLFQLDVQGVVNYVGPQVARYGYQPEEVISHHLAEFIHPDDEDLVLREFADVVTSGREFIGQYRLVDKQGGLVWMEASGQELRDASGKIIGTSGVLRDVTARKRMEGDLLKSEDRFRRIFEDGPVGMVISDAGFRFVMANSRFCRMVGYTEKELCELTFKEITHPDHAATDFESVVRLQTGEIPTYQTEKRYVRKDGEVVWGSVTVTAMRDDVGRFLYFLAMVGDITERKQAESALRSSEERYRQIVESTDDTVWEVDADWVCSYLSPQTRTLLGYEPGEMIGRRLLDFVRSEEADRMEDVLRLVATRRRSFRGLEVVALHKAGHSVLLEFKGVPRLGADGSCSGYRGLCRQVAGRKKDDGLLQAGATSRARLCSLIDALEGAVFWTTPDGVIQSWNAGAERLFGYPADEIVGRPIAGLIPSESGRREEGGLPCLLHGNSSISFRTEGLRRGGARTSVIVTVRTISDGGGSALAFFIRDVAAVQRTQQEIRQGRMFETIG